MIGLFSDVIETLAEILFMANSGSEFAMRFVPFILFIEVPFYSLVLIGLAKYITRRHFSTPLQINYRPSVSCIVLCYAEGEGILASIRSLVEQQYAGHIQIIVVIDGAVQNGLTYQVALAAQKRFKHWPRREIILVPKWQRGGRVSSINAGFNKCRGLVTMVLDGDTSFDNDMVANSTPHFANENVVAVSGSLRVRNVKASVVTRLQAIEYLISIHTSKVGLSEFNVVNNISGAFGIFRTEFIKAVGGWDAGTAEDLDLTMRIKQYFGRHRNLRIVFEPTAIGHTDVPETMRAFLLQRLRWDGDLYWLYFRKHSPGFVPRLLGWANFIGILWYGVLFQIVMPFMILIYLVYSFLVYQLSQVVAILVLVYGFYLLVTTVFYTVGVAGISERPRADLKQAWLVPFFPGFMLVIRLWATVAVLSELFLHNSRYSTMAPFWVLKRNKY